MHNIIPNILSKEQLVIIQGLLDSCTYIEGKTTAGAFAQEVKNNEQVKVNTCPDVANIAMTALMINQQFQLASFCKTINDPIFSRYTEGMYYGSHTDDPLMRGRSGMFRTDIAMTLFLNEPTEYEGGELCINSNEYKLDAGSLLLYPADTIHQVKPVTYGVRHVMVNWCQSYIRDAEKRQILLELNEINHVYNKLVRMWADT